ncbi:putative ribonuclease H-like domain-containing protein, partial [Tanacetum coccineum]
GNPQQDLKDKRVIDSGCSRHMTGNKSYLSEYEEIDGGFVAFGGNPTGGKITGKGKIRTGKLDFEDVYFVKELKFNLFSVSQMCDKKNNVLFTDTECVVLSPDFKLLDESQVLLRVPRKNNMYSVDIKNVVPSGGLTCLFANATLDESNLWHRRLGHVNFKTMNKLVKGNLVRGLPSNFFEINQTCVVCQKGNQHKASCKTKTVSSISQPLQMLHMDLFGPTFVKSLMKKMYCLVVTDDYSRFSWVFFLATKDETSEIFKTFITGLENLIDLRVKVIRCDNGTEFKNRIMNQFYEIKGIKREFSVARTPQQNGVAERKNITLIETAKTMLADSKLPTTFWAEAVNTAYALTKSMNYEPVVAGNQSNGNAGIKEKINAGKASVETVPDKDYILLPLWTQDPPFSSSSKDSSKARFKPSREKEKQDAEDLRNEHSEVPRTEGPRVNQQKDASVNSTNAINTVSLTVNVAGIEDNVVDENIVSGCADDANMPELEDIVHSDDDEDVGAEADMTNLDIHILVSPIPATRIHKDYPIEQIIEDIHSAPQTRRMTKNVTEQAMFKPKKVIQALTDPSWIEAMQDELLQFKLQKVWTLVDLPYGKMAIGKKWVYKNKKDERGIVVRNKARLVAQGHTQEEGIDYDKVFAPVARIEAIRLFLAYASFKDFVVYQMDVKSAFLYVNIEEEVYVCQPPRFEDPEFPAKVYKIENLEPDDIIFGSTKKELCTEFEILMHKKFQMSLMGELTFFLGLQVTQKADGIFISQDKYVDEILKKFGFSTVKTASTPMETSKPLMKDDNAEYVDVHLYRSMIGSLMYLTSSRPDIMFVVFACARFQVTPKVSHLHVVKRIFRYLKGQLKLGLWYPKDSPFDLEAYTDSDYAGASLDKKFTTGGCQFLRSRLISWQCKKQTIVANSTTEAEYVAASIKNPVFHSKTKYIEIRHHFIRDSNEKNLIQMIKIHTDQNIADLFTKAFDVSRFQYLVAISKPRKAKRATEISQSSGHIPLVANETVTKEWEDRMERAATTASSLEAEQDSGSGLRCQDTILRGVEAQTKFETVSKKSNDPPLLKVHTLGSGEDSMKL